MLVNPILIVKLKRITNQSVNLSLEREKMITFEKLEKIYFMFLKNYKFWEHIPKCAYKNAKKFSWWPLQSSV